MSIGEGMITLQSRCKQNFTSKLMFLSSLQKEGLI